MSEERDSEGLVALDELAALAELFDKSENALDPFSEESQDAETQFEKLVSNLYKERVLADPRFSGLSDRHFQAYLRSACRKYLRKN